MIQEARLCFRDYKGIDHISGISQRSKEGSHILLPGANDWCGRNASDRVDLLAPYDCVVKAIATADNTVFFESLDKVKTPTGTYDHCWFMCTHILDADKKALGICVGKKFKQGEPCFTEGTKGIGSGNHIHMEQGFGTFGGGSCPYYKSCDTFVFNGKTYAQYYPVLSEGSWEAPLKDMMFISPVEVVRGCNTGKGLPDYYSMKVASNDQDCTVRQLFISNDCCVKVRSCAGTDGSILGTTQSNAYYNILEECRKSDYTWYRIGVDAWIAGVEGTKVIEPSKDEKGLIKFTFDRDNYEYRWSVDGNKYGDKYDVTTMAGHADEKLVADGWQELLAVNGGLFYTWDKQHFANGLEKSRGINNQELEMTAVTDYNNAMSIGCTYNGELVFAKQSYIMSHLDEYYGAITAIGLLLNGKECDYGHAEFKSQYNQVSGRTIIGEDKDGNYMSYSFAGETGKSGLTGAQATAKCKELGFYNAIMLDGGGSVCRRVNGKNDITTTRAIKNALLLYRKPACKKQEEQPKEEPKPIPVEEDNKQELLNEICSLKAQLENANTSLCDANKSLSEANERIKYLDDHNKELLDNLNNIEAKEKELNNKLTLLSEEICKIAEILK